MASAILAALYAGNRAEAHRLARMIPLLDVFEAAALGDADALAQRLEEDPTEVDAIAPDGFTPLHLAAYFGGLGAARLLIGRGATIDGLSQNAMSVTPLQSAVSAHQATLVSLLLAKGADPNVAQRGGIVPLHQAAQNGDDDSIEALLVAGARREVRSDDGRLPIDFASPEKRASYEALLRF